MSARKKQNNSVSKISVISKIGIKRRLILEKKPAYTDSNLCESQQLRISDSEQDKVSAITDNSVQYVGFWRRFLASFLDLLIIGIPAGTLSVILTFLSSNPAASYLTELAVVIFIIYMDSTKGGTPGKLILGLRIIDENGSFMTIPTAILRYIGKMVSGIIFGIGYFMIGWDIKKQGMHDKIAKTYVIKI